MIRANLAPLSFVDVTREEYIEGLLGIYELGRIDVVALINELQQLHEGNTARCRLRPSQFAHWLELQQGDKG